MTLIVALAVTAPAAAMNLLKSSEDAIEVESVPVAGVCIPDSKTLCVNHNRFAVTVHWAYIGNSGDGLLVTSTADSGFFYFFDPTNVELVVKVLDACALRHRFWVFATGLTNVGVAITVTDTKNGKQKTYNNVLGHAFQPIQDTGAFATCP